MPARKPRSAARHRAVSVKLARAERCARDRLARAWILASRRSWRLRSGLQLTCFRVGEGRGSGRGRSGVPIEQEIIELLVEQGVTEEVREKVRQYDEFRREKLIMINRLKDQIGGSGG